MKKFIMFIVLMFAAIAHADTVFSIKSVADTSSVTASRFGSLAEVCLVDYSQTDSLASANFGTEIKFPDGTSSVVITALATTLKRRISGVDLAPVVIGLSRFNPEGDLAKPSYFVLNASGAVVSVLGANSIGTTVQNPKHFYITEYGVAAVAANVHPRLLGDYCEVIRQISGTYVLNGTEVPFTNIVTSSKVIVLQMKNHTTMVYETPAGFDTATGGSITLMNTSLTPANYLIDWWFESSAVFDGTYNFATDFLVSGTVANLVITYPSGVFFRIVAAHASPPTP